MVPNNFDRISLILNVEMLDFWTLGHRVNMDPGRLNGVLVSD